MTQQQLKQAHIFLRKARNDEALLDLILENKNISDDIFGFHCQQAAEKLLKAVLSVMLVRFKPTHNIRVLIDLLADNKKPLPVELQEIDFFTPYAILLRYEEIDPPPPAVNRKKFRDLVKSLRAWVTPQIQKEN